VRFLDAATIRGRLPWPRIIEALAGAFQTEVQAPLRSNYTVQVPGEPSGTLLLMPAWRSGERLGVKVVTVFPGNAARAQPSVAAIYVLFDAQNGRPLVAMDGEEITARRTAAASALASGYLARVNARHLVMVGAGRQARGLIEAHAHVRPIECVTIWSRTRAHAEITVAAMASHRFQSVVCTNLERAVGEADIVCCATLATEPIVHGSWLAPGTHVDLVGAFKADMRETDDDVMRRAATIVVDDRRAVLAEGGDIVQAVLSGAIDASRISADLRELIDGRHRGRVSDDEITVFKSVGFGLEDLAAAEAAFDATLDSPPNLDITPR
jgi:ornithine cyclodeaminase